jgi:hypothetical protein
METIHWTCEHGLERRDSGRTGERHDTLCSFKRSFGVEEASLECSTLGGVAAPVHRRGQGWREMVIRRSPASVDRVAGELLFRDFAG